MIDIKNTRVLAFLIILALLTGTLSAPIFVQRLADLGLLMIMFILICFGWLLFRSPSLETIGQFIFGINVLEYSSLFATIGFYIWPLLAFQVLQLWRQDLEPLSQMPWFFRFNIQLFVIFSLLFLASPGGQQFIYFNF